MKKINKKEQNAILMGILIYIDNICKNNNLNYSLIGGSLIGCIRNGGIIPWDDDIDIILMPEDYNKLIDILKKDNNTRYKIICNEIDNNYFYPFVKVIDTYTFLEEKNMKKIENYGLYVDIFSYHYVSNNCLIRYFEYKLLIFIKMMIGCSSLNIYSNNENIVKKIRNIIAKKIGNKKFLNIYRKMCFNHKKTNYIISNWPAYGYSKEVQKSEYFEEYKYAKFENTNIMITKKYDEVLKNTFGNYMKLPPVEQRVSHGIESYWRDSNDEENKE